MKRFLLFFAALLCCVSSFAQMNFVATLQHNDSISHYYGQEALNQAYTAAMDGDIITLSDGTFFADWAMETIMCKSLTIRGTAGTGGYTLIRHRNSNYNSIYIATRNKSLTTRFEGVCLLGRTYVINEDAQFEKGKIEFIKCRISELYANATGTPNTESPMVYVYNCIVDLFAFDNPLSYPKYNVVNSYVCNPRSRSDIGNNISIFEHCLINYSNGVMSNGYNLNFTNCIITSKYNDSRYDYGCIFPTTTSVSNCLIVHNPYILNRSFSSANNQFIDDIASVFKTFNFSVGDGETFELTDEAKTTYLGNDSTQLGMYGGIAPYNTKMQYPVVTKLMPEPRTTKDGKLTIDVQVDGK